MKKLFFFVILIFAWVLLYCWTEKSHALERDFSLMYEQCVLWPHARWDISCNKHNDYAVRIMEALNTLDYESINVRERSEKGQQEFVILLNRYDTYIEEKKSIVTDKKTLLWYQIMQLYFDFWYNKVERTKKYSEKEQSINF